MNSGRAASSSANSSTITSRSGIGGIDAVGVAARLVGDDVVEVAGLAQHRLAPLLLADQRGVHAVDERQVALQVRDQAGHVREPREVGERGAALVVDEHERQLLGRVARGQAGDQRAQQLALARAGGADEHAVRAHAALGRLLEVELEHLAVGRAADRRAQALGRAGRRRHWRSRPPSRPLSRTAVPSPRSPSPPSASRSGVSVRAIASLLPRSAWSRNTSGIDGASCPHSSHIPAPRAGTVSRAWMCDGSSSRASVSRISTARSSRARVSSSRKAGSSLAGWSGV